MGSQNMHEGAEEAPQLRGSAGEGDIDRPAKKSKGGRKLIYATLEQRKQRNRDAQAAFRERRSEHIIELEKTVQEQKIKLQASQAAHTSAKDECLLLRYKNSLLERILLEKGIPPPAADIRPQLHRTNEQLGIDVNSELNNILEVRPQQHSISQRQNHVRPITKNTVSNAPPTLDTNVPSSPSKTSRCCDHCSAPPRKRTFTPQLTPISNGFSPMIETKAVDKRPLSQDATHFSSTHPHKRQRYSTHSTGNHSGGSSMMRKYNMHQSFPYPQAPYSLAPDTQVTRMNVRSQGAFEERTSHEALYSSTSTESVSTDQCVNHGAEVINDQEESDGNTACSSRTHSVYSPPDYPPMQMQPPFFNSKILDFDHPPVTQLMGSYDPNFELDLEFLSSIQA